MNAMLEGLQQGHHQAFGGIGQRMTFDNDAGAHHNKSAREMAGGCLRKEFHLHVYCLTCFKQSGMDNVSLYVLWLLNEKDSLCQVAALEVLTD